MTAHEHRASPGPAAPWREAIRGGHPPVAALGLSGAEQLRAGLAGDGPQPPLNHLTGMRITAVGDGTATARMPLTGWLQGITGPVELGPLVIPADAAMACAIISQLPAWGTFTTTELALRVLAPPAPGAELIVTARVIAPGPPLALAEATLCDETGTVVAHSTSLGLLISAGEPHAIPEPPRYCAPTAGPDPWQRTPPEDLPVAPLGPDRLRALAAGELAPPPLHLFTGLEIAALAPGHAELTLPATPWFCAPPPGRVQGGVTAVLAEAAQAIAVAAALPAGSAFAPVEIKVNYLRPLASDGRRAHAHARAVHTGRRTAVATAELVDADGRPVAVATGSGLVTERP